VLKRKCATCGKDFEAQRSTSKYCKPSCRVRASQTKAKLVLVPPTGRGRAGHSERCRRHQIRRRRRRVTACWPRRWPSSRRSARRTVDGQLALRHAARLQFVADTASGTAALSRELRQVLDAARRLEQRQPRRRVRRHRESGARSGRRRARDDAGDRVRRAGVRMDPGAHRVLWRRGDRPGRARRPRARPRTEAGRRREAVLRPGGKWVALEEAIIESRQNGKTTNVVLPVVLFDLFMLPPDRIVWTAHLFKTARDAFDDFVRLHRDSARAVAAREEHQLRERRRSDRAALRCDARVPGPPRRAAAAVSAASAS
jgi:hypothetical protein